MIISMSAPANRFLLAFVLASTVLAFHQAIVFFRSYVVSDLLPIPNTNFWPKELDPSLEAGDRLWLLGSGAIEEDLNPEVRWMPLLEKFPNDPKVTAKVAKNVSLSIDQLEDAGRLAPQNGWFDLLIAEEHAKNVFRQPERPRLGRRNLTESEPRNKLRARPKELQGPEIVDQESLQKTLSALKIASQKDHIDSYVRDRMIRSAEMTVPATDVATAYQNYIIWVYGSPTATSLRESFRAFEHQLEDFAETGQRDKFFDLVKTMESISWTLHDSAACTLQLLTARNQLVAIAEAVVESGQKLDLDSELKPYQERIGRSEKYHSKRDETRERAAFNDENVSALRYSSLITPSIAMRKQISDEDLRPSVLAEQAQISWRFLLYGFLVISIFTIICALLSKFFKNARQQRSKFFVALSVSLPIFGFLIYRYLSPWGGYHKGPG